MQEVKFMNDYTGFFSLSQTPLRGHARTCKATIPSAEFGRSRRDLSRARPFLGPYYLYIVKTISRVHLPYSADWAAMHVC